MKKIYLMGLTAALALSVNAQTTVRLKNPLYRGEKQFGTAAKPASPSQVICSIVCNTQYTAGATQDLVMNYTASNTDFEYVDYLEINFPAGITPNSSPNATFPSSSAGGGTATINPISGQTISWGVNDDDEWGPIITTAAGVTFTVNVTVTAGLTGTQTANYLASGDGYDYYGAAGDVNSSFIIYPAGASVVNMRAKYAQPSTITAINNCGLGIDQIYTRIINGSTAAQSNFTVNYSVNSVASTPSVVAGPLAAGDSIDLLLPTTYDFSGSNIYAIKAWVNQTGDVNLSNDTAALTISNSVSVPLTSSTYSNGAESLYEYGSVNRTWIGTGLPFQFNTTDVHSGVLSYNYQIGTANPAASYTAVNVFPCVDVTAGEVYRISWWNKVDATPVSNGMVSITTGAAQTAAGTATILKPYTAITPGAWVKDSVDYVATVSGTRYFAIRGKGTLTASSAVNVRLDDVMIQKVVGSVGIKTNSLSEISIFPNPTTGILNINAVEVNSSVEVFNIIGEKVYSNTLVKGSNSIDLSGLSSGSYFVKMNSNDQVITKKVVVSK